LLRCVEVGDTVSCIAKMCGGREYSIMYC